MDATAVSPVVHLVAVRHGQSTLNAEGRLTGQLDPPLTALGREQAALLSDLAGAGYDCYLHSGAQRARDTLAIACRAAGLDGAALTEDARWRERSYGALAGGPPGTWEQPVDVDAAPPGGESYRQLGLRVLDALQDLRERAAATPGGELRVLLCAHSGVLRVLRGIVGGAETLAPLLSAGAANGEALTLRYDSVTMPGFLGGPQPPMEPGAPAAS
jgi:broad specificity phosphatase PhoE